MKRLVFSALLAAGTALAVEVNDLAPDFDNTIEDDGYWCTTNHQYVAVSEASSAGTAFESLETRVGTSASGSIAGTFDSREKTAGRSPALPVFYSTKTGLVILVR